MIARMRAWWEARQARRPSVQIIAEVDRALRRLRVARDRAIAANVATEARLDRMTAVLDAPEDPS